VRFLWASNAAVDPLAALGLGVGAEGDLDSRPSHHDHGEEHGHDEFASFALDLPAVADPEALERQLVSLAKEHDILRMKGFMAVEGKPMRLVVQAVGDRVARWFDRPWRPGEARRSRLVVIGLAGLEREPLEAALSATSPVPTG
jgi:cobalamin biosynthesis protein CobW